MGHQVNYVHYWTDSPTSQYRNKTIFNVVAAHKELFGYPASWNYMKSGHGKGHCDPIGGVAKRMADLSVKNKKTVIQDAEDFYTCARKEKTALTYKLVTCQDYERCKKFLTLKFSNACTVTGTMKVHAVFPADTQSNIFVRDTSCFCVDYFSGPFNENTKCDGWSERSLTKSNIIPHKKKIPVSCKNLLFEAGDFVAVV